MAKNDQTPQSRRMSVPQRADADAQDGFANDSPSNATAAASNNAAPLPAGKKHRTPSPSIEKVAGLGPAIAEHSKDAKAVKGGRQPGAYVKD